MTTTEPDSSFTDDFDNTDTNPADPSGAPAQEPEKDWKAEHDKVLREARKHEDRAKANAAAARELADLKKSSMTDIEKAVATARDEARREALRESGGRIAAAELRGLLNGRVADVDALLEGVDSAKFLDEDGNADTRAMRRWVDKVAPVPDPNRVPRVAGGPRGAADKPFDMNEFIRSGARR